MYTGMVYNVYIKRKGVAMMEKDELVRVTFTFSVDELDVYREMMVAKWSQRMAEGELLGDYERAERALRKVQEWQVKPNDLVGFQLISESTYDYLLRGQAQ